MDFNLLAAFLPLVFMLHDFEEIVMFKPWLEKNRAEIKRRFPRLEPVFARNHDRLSTSGFAVAVLHEFLVVSLITVLSLVFNSYTWWFGAFAAFSIHLLVHIAQWIIYGKYVPVVVTSFLALPYCGFTFAEFLRVTDMTPAAMLLWTAIGLALTAVSFAPAFSIALRFEEWVKRKYLNS